MKKPMARWELVQKLNGIEEWLGAGTINLMGLPFAGKDTQGEVLASRFMTKCHSSGQMIRDAINSGELSDSERHQVESGELVDSVVFHRVVMTGLAAYKSTSHPLMLSGVGKKDGEQEPVHMATGELGHPTRVVPLVTVSLDTAQARATQANRGRNDDDPASVALRFDVFKEETQPVLDYYDEQGLILPVDGEGEPELVFSNLVGSLHDFAR